MTPKGTVRLHLLLGAVAAGWHWRSILLGIAVWYLGSAIAALLELIATRLGEIVRKL